MRRLHAGRPDWVTVTLADPKGQQLANANQPYGTALPTVVDPGSLEQVVLTRRPAIGGLTEGRTRVSPSRCASRCCANARCATY